MKLLIVTQKVNKDDAILGFFHRWIEEFAKHFEKVIVICLEKGEYDLPENVSVYSLGKERKSSRRQYIARFYSLIWSKRKEYDAVFVHMNPEYVVLGGLLWRLIGKKIGLWYMHKSVDLKLRIAELFTHYIFTATSESFRLKSEKVYITGHGIDTDTFAPKAKTSSDILRLLYIGRITPIKNLDKVIEAVEVLKNRNVPIHLTVIGAPVTEADKTFLERVEQQIKRLGLSSDVEFGGYVPSKVLPDTYHIHDLVLNISETGSIDKVLLEALATGTKVLTSNPSLEGVLPETHRTTTDPQAIADSIEVLSQEPFDTSLTECVRKEHNLRHLIKYLGFTYNVAK